MRCAVYGAGAIGGLIAARLAQSGVEVELVCRTAAQADAISRDGLRLVSPAGTTTVAVASTTAPAAGTDVAFVAVKAYALGSMLETGAVGPAGTVVPLLNGLEHPRSLRRALPGTDVRVAAIYAQAARTAPTVIEQRSSVVRIALGRSARTGPDPLTAALTGAGVEVDLAEEQRVLWDKLARVGWAATLSSVAGTAIGAARDARRDDADALARELAAVATADGVRIDADELLAAVWALPPGLEPSMMRDVAAGGPSEVDAITGAVVRRARSLAVPVPVAERLYARLRDPSPVLNVGGPPDRVTDGGRRTKE